VEAYLSGQINEAKSSLKGSGKFATKKGSMEITLETPYDNYKKVETTMSYNRASKSFELKSKSSSSDFAIEIEFKGKLKIHLMVPNAVKPTHLHVEIEPFKGKIHFESRFSLEEFMYTYEVKIVQAKITVDMSTKINGVEKFRLALERDGQKNTGHLEVDLKAINNHELRFHREGFSVITASYKRNSDEIKFDITGSGNLPTKGKLNINVNNTFREPDRTMTIRMDVDRSSAQKSVKIEVEPQPRKLYIVDLTYTATLRNMNTGNWEMKITTPERRNYPWSSTKGNWDFRNPNDSQLEFSMGPKKYTAKGQFGLRESKLVLSSGSGGPNIHLEWKFQRNFDDRDYYLKIGPESRYLLFKLKGTITDIANAYIEGAFRGPLFMTETFTYDSRWSRDASGDVSGSGSFKYGNKEGRHELKMFHRDASTKSAEFSFEATSNIPNFNKLIIKGEYNFNNRAHIDIKIEWDTDNISFKFDIADFNPEYSNNTASLHAPGLGDVELTFGHDFRNRKAKSITAVAKFGANESSVKAEWNRSDDFDTLTGKVVVKSIFLGDIEINFDFDVSNLKDAKAAFNYKRNNSKNVSVNWVRKLTADSLHTEVNFQSHFKTIPSARFYVDVNFKKGLKVDAGIEYSKKITIQLNLGDSKATGKIETPFRGFEKMESEIEYNLKGKQKTVTGRYTRGNNKVSLDINLNMKSKKEGSFNLKLTTPFDAVKNFEVTAAIKNKKADVTYVRNDVTYQFNGKADIKSDKSSIDISFTPSGKSPIKIAAAYDLASIIRGNGNAPQTLLRMKLEFDDLRLESELKGFRNNDRVFIELDVKKSFGLFHNMHLLMDSELNATNRDGSFEFSFDEHTFKAKNHFERKANNGYYFKTEMESSLTPLPALIIGFGRENEERTVTIGYGNGNEITASFKPKENFRKGFYAMVDIPKYNVYNIKCDVEYGFERNNAVFVEADIEFDNGKKVEAKLLYTSEGVKARLSSPFTGKRSIRVLRSITDKSFQAEAGIDDYSMKLRGGFSDDKKNGFNIEGEIFGKKFLIDALVQNEGKQYAEGKLLIETPIYGLHKMGGFFTWSNMDGKILAKSEVIMPTLLMNNPKISAEVNLDLNKKINGAITLNIAGEVFALKSNIIKTTQKGYEGSLELYSPFHALSEVDIRGGIKMESFTNIESNLNIKTPFGSYNIAVNGKSDKPGKFDYELILNQNCFTTNILLEESHKQINLGTKINGVQRTISVDTKIHENNAHQIDVIFTSNSDIHKISGLFNIGSEIIQGNLEINSRIIGGKRKINFNLTTPQTPFRKFSIEMGLIATEAHIFQFGIDTTNNFKLNVNVESSVIPDISLELLLSSGNANLRIIAPNGTHKIDATWLATQRMPADIKGTLELSSPLLKQDYLIQTSLTNGKSVKDIKVHLITDTEKHIFETKITSKKNGGDVMIHVETPFISMKKGVVEISVNFKNKFETKLAASLGDMKHSFDMKYDLEQNDVVVSVESPIIPTGQAVAEARQSGNFVDGLELKMTLKNSQEQVSGTLDLKKASHILLKINTPFKGYKKMNFGATYNSKDNTVVSIFADKPIKFNVDLTFGNKDDAYFAYMKAETPIESFKTVEAEINLPLNKFSPSVKFLIPDNEYGFNVDFEKSQYSYKMNADIIVDAQNYGAHMNLRNKAPYELAAGLHLPTYAKHFHLKTDSSFLFFLN